MYKIRLTKGEHRISTGSDDLILKVGDVFEVDESTFRVLSDRVVVVEDDPVLEEELEEEVPEVLSVPEDLDIDKLNVNYTVLAKLKAGKFYTLRDIINRSDELTNVKGIGQKTADLILQDARKALGL